MKRSVMIWLIVAASLTLVGILIIAGVMTMLGWNFKNLSTVKYETNLHTVDQEYTNISIYTDTTDIVFLPSSDGKTRVECYEYASSRHAVAVVDGWLSIDNQGPNKWYEHIGINFGSPKITVYLPEGEHGKLSVIASTGDTKIPDNFSFESIDVAASTGDISCFASAKESLKIKLSTGNITLEKISADSVDLTTTTGKINVTSASVAGDVSIKVSTGKSQLNNVTCKNLTSSGSTGGVTLNSVIATEKFSIKRSTGDVTLVGCDAAELNIVTDTGDVSGSLLSEKVFITSTDTGKISVPRSNVGGICEITTDTGDIEISVG